MKVNFRSVLSSLALVALASLPLPGQEKPTASTIIRSARSGPWSLGSTWEGGKAPGAGSRVLIRTGHHVRYDVQSAEAIRAINVAGTLSFATDRDTRLDVGLILIQASEAFSEEGFHNDKDKIVYQSSHVPPI